MKKGLLILGVAALMTGPALAADPANINWSKVPASTVKLFYPGQSSYQWLRSPEHKRADRKTAEGDACTSCHVVGKEEEAIGKALVTGKMLEPHPIKGKQAVIDLSVQAAHDAENLYLRAQWKTLQNFPGTAHPHWRYDGKAWKPYGYPRLHKKVWKDGQPAIYEDRFSIMMDDGKVPMFAEQGCWLTCHDGMRDMQKLAKKAKVKAHPLLGKVLHKKDVRKYLPSTRTTENLDWDKTKSAAEVAKLKAAGQFVDLMQWRGHRSNQVDMADDGYVLEYRLFDKGKKMFAKNWDKKKKQPKYMFDASKVGFKAHRAETLRDQSKAPTLIVERNGVKFDPKAGWKKGDLIPQYAVNRSTAKGSAADNDNVKGMWKDGMWTITWTRKLDTGHPADDKIMKAGGVYTVGLAVHDDNLTTRGHHVSWPMTLGIGTKADIEAVTLK